jgi:hypothetical protein
MFDEPLHQPDGWDGAIEASGETQSRLGQPRRFDAEAFGRLGTWMDELLAREHACQQAQRYAESEVVQGQIDRLAGIAALLCETSAECEQLDGWANGYHRELGVGGSNA